MYLHDQFNASSTFGGREALVEVGGNERLVWPSGCKLLGSGWKRMKARSPVSTFQASTVSKGYTPWCPEFLGRARTWRNPARKPSTVTLKLLTRHRWKRNDLADSDPKKEVRFHRNRLCKKRVAHGPRHPPVRPPSTWPSLLLNSLLPLPS